MGKALIFDGITVTDELLTVTITAISEEAEKIADYFEGVDSAKLSVLNTFINSLKSAGVWNKLTYLMLPILASDESEAMQNVLLNTQSLPSDTSKWTLSNGEFKQTTSGTTTLTSYFNNVSSMATKDMSVGAAFALDETPQGTSSQRMLLLNNGVSIFRDGSGVSFNYGGGAISGSSGFKGAGSQISCSTDIANLQYYGIKDDNVSVSTPVSIDQATTINTTTTASLSIGGSGTEFLAPFANQVKLIWVSTLLDSTELRDIHMAVKTFIEALEGLSL